jgi:P-loop containing NTP hydrolase pore-1
MTRLGLWGPGTKYADFVTWHTTVKSGGVGVMELVAMHAKAEGSLLCRTLSYVVSCGCDEVILVLMWCSCDGMDSVLYLKFTASTSWIDSVGQ